jgi:cytochrome c oxidase cbb3-type subunit 3
MRVSFRAGAFLLTVIVTGLVARQISARGQAAAPQAPASAPAAASPASQTPPKTVTEQTYPQEQIARGETAFQQNCAFCHGRDAGGGETGPDLTRSPLVAEDVRGDKIGPVVHGGRVDKGMPSFTLPDQDLAAIVAFIHDQKTKADSEQGGRQHVTPDDLETGNAAAGKAFFEGEGKCTSCHSAAGDLAGVGNRFQGLALLQRMLYPGGRGTGPTATATVTLASGQSFSGKVAYRDEFTIALRDAGGKYHSWPTDSVKFTVTDPMQAHVDLLGKYTDEQMHNVYAYLETLK